MKKQHNIKILSLSNAEKFIVPLMLTIFASAYCKPPVIDLNTSQLTADPGNKITFTWKIDDNQKLIRFYNDAAGAYLLYNLASEILGRFLYLLVIVGA